MEYLGRAFKDSKIRSKLLFTFFVIVLSRVGSQIPLPGLDRSYLQNWFNSNVFSGGFNIISAFTGGSFERMSIFALNITPYITSSIIIQLLTIVIPSLEELTKDGKEGEKKIKKITIYLAIALAIVESLAMVIGFGKSGLLSGNKIVSGILIIVLMTAGTGFLIFLGEKVDKKGIGNGISIILLANIISRLPNDIVVLMQTFVLRKTIAKGILAFVIIVAVIVAIIAFTVVLNESVRRIPIIYAQTRGTAGQGIKQKSFLPIKVNTSSVIPIIFASSLFSIPQIISSVVGVKSNFILNCLNQNYWFNFRTPQYTLGFLIYVLLVVFFAYFYTSITMNPVELADNLKKQNASIPGVRAGKPTEDYIRKILNRVIIIGVTGLIIVVSIPMILNGVFNTSVSMGGTSLIIVVGVILETVEVLDSEMAVHSYKSLL